MNNEPFPLYGDGFMESQYTQRHDPAYFTAALQNLSQGPAETENERYNVNILPLIFGNPANLK